MRHKVLARECNGRFDVVERLVRPDPEIVEDCCDRDLLEVGAVFHHGGAQIHDAVDMVPIADEVGPQLRRVIA